MKALSRRSVGITRFGRIAAKQQQAIDRNQDAVVHSGCPLCETRRLARFRSHADLPSIAAEGDCSIAQSRHGNRPTLAVERGAFGIPTFYVDGEMWFGKERLGQIEDYLGGGKP